MTSVQARRFRAGGEPAGSQFQVNANTTNRQEHPAVAMDADGDFVVVWASYGSYGDDRSQASVQGQRFDADGARLGEQFQVNTVTTGPQDRPAVAMDADGDFVVVWGVHEPGPALRVRRRAFSPAGKPLDFGRPIELHEDFSVTRVADLAPAVAAPSAGEMVVVWGHSYYQSISGGRFTTLGLSLGDFQGRLDAGRLRPGGGGRSERPFPGGVEPGRGRRFRDPRPPARLPGRRPRLPRQPDGAVPTRRPLHGGGHVARLPGGYGLRPAVQVRSDNSGLFWFFDADNWELLVKVLDGCAINDRFWVFAAATTNVAYTLRVTDETRGVYREYANALGRAAPAVTDTSAFATCP